MKTFKITGVVEILHNGKRYKKGETIELEKKEAERLNSYLTPAKKSRGSAASNDAGKAGGSAASNDAGKAGGTPDTNENKTNQNEGDK
jgi:hypothetical protein